MEGHPPYLPRHRRLLSHTTTSTGVISTVEDTDVTVNKVSIYANTFTFRIERLEKDFSGLSHTVGWLYDPGQTVTIEYITTRPQIARIQGTHSGFAPLWLFCFMSSFISAGPIFIIFKTLPGFKKLRLLKRGKMTTGILRSKETAQTLTFEFFDDHDTIYETVVHSHHPQKIEDVFKEPLLYNPQNPSQVLMLDDLPPYLIINQAGNLQTLDSGSTRKVFIIPTLVITIHSLIFLYLIS